MTMGFLDKEKVIRYYNDNEEPEEPEEEMSEVHGFDVAENLNVYLPPGEERTEEVKIGRDLAKQGKNPWKMVKLDEENQPPALKNELIFGCYSSRLELIPAKIKDFRNSLSDETASSRNLTQNEVTQIPVDLYNDSYEGSNPVLLKRLKSSQIPCIVINPDYFQSSQRPNKSNNLNEVKLL